jgi:hypothetical protein
MPYYVAPETPEDRLHVFEETIKYTAAEITATRPSPVKPETITGVTAFISVFKPLVTALTEKLGTRSREVSESTAAKTVLEITTRDYIEVLKRRTRRKGHAAAVLVNHGLPENGDTPNVDSWITLKQVATALIAGDALSTTDYGAMQNPSAAELQTALDKAQEEHEDVAPADSAVQAAQNALATQADSAKFWIEEIRYDALDFARREDDPGQRRLLRKLGYRFKTLPGETPEDTGDGTTPPPTGTTPTN